MKCEMLQLFTLPSQQDLWATRSRLPAALQNTSAFRSILSALLLTNWHRGDGKDLFSTKTGQAELHRARISLGLSLRTRDNDSS